MTKCHPKVYIVEWTYVSVKTETKRQSYTYEE